MTKHNCKKCNLTTENETIWKRHLASMRHKNTEETKDLERELVEKGKKTNNTFLESARLLSKAKVTDPVALNNIKTVEKIMKANSKIEERIAKAHKKAEEKRIIDLKKAQEKTLKEKKMPKKIAKDIDMDYGFDNDLDYNEEEYQKSLEILQRLSQPMSFQQPKKKGRQSVATCPYCMDATFTEKGDLLDHISNVCRNRPDAPSRECSESEEEKFGSYPFVSKQGKNLKGVKKIKAKNNTEDEMNQNLFGDTFDFGSYNFDYDNAGYQNDENVSNIIDPEKLAEIESKLDELINHIKSISADDYNQNYSSDEEMIQGKKYYVRNKKLKKL